MGALERSPRQPKTVDLHIFGHNDNGSTFVYVDKSGNNRNTQFYHIPATRREGQPIIANPTLKKP